MSMRYLVVLVIIFMGEGLFARSECSTIFSTRGLNASAMAQIIFEKWRSPSNDQRIDEQVYREKKAYFLNQLVSSSDVVHFDIRKPEYKLALLEAILIRYKIEGSSLDQILKSGSREQKRQLARLIEKFRIHISAAEAEQLMLDLQQLVRRRHTKFSDMLKSKLGLPIDDVIKMRILDDLVRAEFVQILNRLGLVGDLTFIGKARSWRKLNKKREEFLVSGLLPSK